MKALIIAPLPPPMSGNALPPKVLCEELQKMAEIGVINLSRTAHGSGGFAMGRVRQIIRVLRQIWRKHKGFDVVYLTVAESFGGNLRDLVIYVICRSRLSSVIIHMLGGAGMNGILANRRSLRHVVNRFFISKLGGIIVEGATQRRMFAQLAEPSRIHIVPNFAEDYLFETEPHVAANFDTFRPLRILFLSNMLYGKGHLELVDAYFELRKELRERVAVDFAGALVDKREEAYLLSRIRTSDNLRYHGPVAGDAKRRLYSEAHVFCLPTYYPYEGQPCCIIEAYATGCAVITTTHSGIKDVFTDGVNGYEVTAKSVPSLVAALEKALQHREELRRMATGNLQLAQQRYTQARFLASMTSAISSLSTSPI